MSIQVAPRTACARLFEEDTGYLQCVFSGDAQVVSDHPEPMRARVIPVGCNRAHGDPALARDTDVGRRLFVIRTQIDFRGGERLHDRVPSGILFELGPHRYAVAMED